MVKRCFCISVRQTKLQHEVNGQSRFTVYASSSLSVFVITDLDRCLNTLNSCVIQEAVNSVHKCILRSNFSVDSDDRQNRYTKKFNENTEREPGKVLKSSHTSCLV